MVICGFGEIYEKFHSIKISSLPKYYTYLSFEIAKYLKMVKKLKTVRNSDIWWSDEGFVL